MTPEESQALPAGRDMDALVAWKVTKYMTCDVRDIYREIEPGSPADDLLPHYSTDIEHAWLVVEAMKKHQGGPAFELLWSPEDEGSEFQEWVAVFGARCLPGQQIVEASGPTAPLAICRAALIAEYTKKELVNDP